MKAEGLTKDQKATIAEIIGDDSANQWIIKPAPKTEEKDTNEPMFLARRERGALMWICTFPELVRKLSMRYP